MIDKFLSTVNKYNMLSEGDRVLLAVSGGADSAVMLSLFIEIMQTLSLTLEVAHIEHGIRGEASVNDAEFVKQMCDKYGIRFSVLCINAPKEAKSAGMSVEAYSRKRRYEFFDTFDADKIATAHNADDNAETLLFRLARGSGLKGAASIPPVRGKIIRPLIECSGEEIRVYAAENGIEYRVDSTNAENAYTRNYIRNIVVPSLRTVNTAASAHINEFISDTAEDNDFLSKTAQKALEECLADNKLNISKLNALHISVMKRVISLYFSRNGIALDRLHLNEILKLLNKAGRVQIKHNTFAVSYNNMLYFYKSGNENQLKIPHTDTIRSNNFNICDVDFYCDYDKIVGNVYFRFRQAGDVISPAGRGCTKTLKKLFNEYKIPQQQRNCIPVICDDLGIIGILGYCADERVKADDGTKTIFYCNIPMEDQI